MPHDPAAEKKAPLDRFVKAGMGLEQKKRQA